MEVVTDCESTSVPGAPGAGMLVSTGATNGAAVGLSSSKEPPPCWYLRVGELQFVSFPGSAILEAFSKGMP